MLNNNGRAKLIHMLLINSYSSVKCWKQNINHTYTLNLLIQIQSKKLFATFCCILCADLYREEAIRLHVFKIKETIISHPLTKKITKAVYGNCFCFELSCERTPC